MHFHLWGLEAWISIDLCGNVHVLFHARGQLINSLISGRMMLYSVGVMLHMSGCYERHPLTLSTLNLPLSSSSTTSRELLSQFSTCSG